MGLTGSFFARSGIQSVFRLLGVAFCLTMTAQPESGSDRAREISDRILAPCCWREAVGVHQSPAAEELRQRIRGEIAAGRSDEAILESLVREYGKRILREPDGQQRQWLYWIPVVLAGGGAVLVARFMRRSAAASQAALSSTTGAALPEIGFLDED